MGLFDRTHSNRVLVGLPVELLGSATVEVPDGLLMAVDTQDRLKPGFQPLASFCKCLFVCPFRAM